MKYEDMEEVDGKKKGWAIKMETGTVDDRERGSQVWAISSAKRNPPEKQQRQHTQIFKRKLQKKIQGFQLYCTCTDK